MDTVVTLGLLHYVYLIMTVLIIAILLMKKEIVLPCIIGIFLMGFAASGNVVTAVQVLYNSLVNSGTNFWVSSPSSPLSSPCPRALRASAPTS